MSRNIAVVEDDRDLGRLICARLEGAGYHCFHLANSEKAFAVLKEKKPDLVILDVMMPKVNGYELCRQIRRDPLIYLTPILMLSALGGEPEMAHALEQGADDYLVKPFDVGVLFARVKSLFEKQGHIMQKNPLTGLRGREFIKKVITNKLFRDELMAACYFTLMHFAPYAKLYGPQKRDDAIRLMADILKEVTNDTGVYECVISHLGGPDFIVLLSIKDYERYCNEGVLRFRNQRNALYSAVDADRGAVTIEMDGGGMVDHPIMSVAVGVITNERMKFRDSGQMVKVAGEVNRRAQMHQSNGHTEIVREGILI